MRRASRCMPWRYASVAATVVFIALSVRKFVADPGPGSIAKYTPLLPFPSNFDHGDPVDHLRA